MRALIIVQACVFLSVLAVDGELGATEISGPQSGVLALVDSPFTVTADISVEADEGLTIEAGCELRFLTGVRFNVYGTLRAEGTAESPIAFLADGTDWSGINCFQENDCVFRHFTISGAETGLHIFDGVSLIEDGDIGPNIDNGLRIESDTVEARRLVLHESQTVGYTALIIYEASPQLYDCEVWGCPDASGVGVWGPAAPLLSGFDVHDCQSGITCVASSPHVDQSWIHDNGFENDFNSGAGLYIGYAGGVPLVTNSRIEGNCFGVAVVFDGLVNLGDLVNDFPDDDGLNRFVGNDLYDGQNRHVWNGTTNTLLAQNCFWAAADEIYTLDVELIDSWIVDDDEGEGAEVVFEPLAAITAAPEPATVASWRCHPNPANPTFMLSGDLPEAGWLRVRLITPAGRLAAELLNGPAESGAFTRTFSSRKLPSGIYLVRIDLDGSPLAASSVAILR